MQENDLNQTLNDLLDEFDRLDAESTRLSDRVGERETPGGKNRKELREQSEIDLLYSDPQVIDFWKSEGQRYSYLYWVRAMIQRNVEPVRIDPCLTPVADDQTQLDQQRLRIYDLLAELLENPTRDLAERLANGALLDSLRAAPLVMSGHPAIEKGLAELAVFVGHDVEELLNELRMEYARIIYDSFFPYVSPYESIYLGDRQVQGERTGQVYRDYNAAGLKAEGELPDHIMHECAFVAEMLRQKLKAGEEGNAKEAEQAQQRQDRFLAEHLLPWATRFGHDFERVAGMREENSRERPAQNYATGIGKLVVGFFTLEANRFHATQPLSERLVRFTPLSQEDNAS
ncbi:MAG: molecular chaperone TorD family protein [Rhodobacteraceae bacterium]|nr:molecular chaperone TorD family protein [Paracoccaceae bacterium]